MKIRYFLIVLWLCVTTTVQAEEKVCEVDRPSIVERIENRSYPSVFGAWHYQLLNAPRPEDIREWSYTKEMLGYHDLYWNGLFRGLRWRLLTPEGPKLVSVQAVEQSIHRKNQIYDLNTNHLHLTSVMYYGAVPDEYPEDWPYWLRDKSGNRIQDEGWSEFLIDWTHPGAQDHFVQQAIAISKCGIFDGIFMDWWNESEQWDQEMAHLYHGSKVDALVSMVSRMREAVGDDFLIIVNTGSRTVPRSAPYVNGVFMEITDPIDFDKKNRLIEIENALLWYEENLRYPQVTCLEGWGLRNEPLNSPKNQQIARVFTTLSLTHSDGHVSFVTGIVSTVHTHSYEIWKGHSQAHVRGITHDHTHEKYWYDFYDAPLGRPIGGDESKGVLYETPKGELIDGMFIREFTGGWAVYNRSGKEQWVYLPEKATGVASGVENKHWHTLGDLDGEIYLKPVSAAKEDVNADGVVNILDLVQVANGFNGNAPDLNGDGIVNILDLVLVSQRMSGSEN